MVTELCPVPLLDLKLISGSLPIVRELLAQLGISDVLRLLPRLDLLNNNAAPSRLGLQSLVDLGQEAIDAAKLLNAVIAVLLDGTIVTVGTGRESFV